MKHTYLQNVSQYLRWKDQEPKLANIPEQPLLEPTQRQFRVEVSENVLYLRVTIIVFCVIVFYVFRRNTLPC